ncbi:MAG TPA: cyclic nucleotide-binding domain-containing protein [Solirubrobacteraceae bacterium]|nr:cyclic nucleotide-binding domain-containing protein [Solirubrobacteraceae bacterium]
MLRAELKDVPFFSSLSKRDLTTVAQQMEEIDIPEGKELVREGDFGHEFFLIVDGTAEVVRGGARIAERGPGEFFGEMALLDEERRTATVTAKSPMRVLVMTRQNFRALDGTAPEIHATVAEAIEARRAATPAAGG